MASFTRPNPRRRFTKTQRYAVLFWCCVMSCILSAFVLGTPTVERFRLDGRKPAAADSKTDPSRYVGTVVGKSPWDDTCTKYTIDNRAGRLLGVDEVGCPVSGNTARDSRSKLGTLEGARFRSVKRAFGRDE